MHPEEQRNAIEILKHDHREVESLFSDFEEKSSDQLGIGLKICTELLVHARIEEEIFYPAAKKALADAGNDLVAEATVEHGSLKQLIAELDGSGPEDELFEARFKVLKEYVQHHVKEEEQQLMPAVERTSVDLEALGGELLERKEALKRMLEKKSARSGSRNKLRIPKMTSQQPRRSSRSGSRTTTSQRRADSRAPSRPAAKKTPAGASSRRPPRKAATAKRSARARVQTRRARGERH